MTTTNNQNIEIIRIASTTINLATMTSDFVYAVRVDGVEIGTVTKTTRTWTRKPAGRRYSTRSGETPTWKFRSNGARFADVRSFDTRKAAVAALIKTTA